MAEAHSVAIRKGLSFSWRLGISPMVRRGRPLFAARPATAITPMGATHWQTTTNEGQSVRQRILRWPQACDGSLCFFVKGPALVAWLRVAAAQPTRTQLARGLSSTETAPIGYLKGPAKAEIKWPASRRCGVVDPSGGHPAPAF